MRATLWRSSVLLPLLATPVLAGCEPTGSCEDNRISTEVSSGTYGLAEAGSASAFPHEGRDVTLEVDREAGIVTARWVDDGGRSIVETWRIAHVSTSR